VHRWWDQPHFRERKKADSIKKKTAPKRGRKFPSILKTPFSYNHQMVIQKLTLLGGGGRIHREERETEIATIGKSWICIWHSAEKKATTPANGKKGGK